MIIPVSGAKCEAPMGWPGLDLAGPSVSHLIRKEHGMTHTMEIFTELAENGSHGWMVKDNSPEVKELFGTDVLPLPFLAQTPAELVIFTLRERNPDAEITVR